MNPLLKTVLIFLTALAFGAPAPLPVSAERLRATPLTIYPNFDVRGTAIVTIFNGFAREDDALVVSHLDAFKGGFRVAHVGVTRGQVWIHVPWAASLGQTFRQNVEGARGLVYVPSRATRTNLRLVAGQLADEAKALRVPLIVGLDDRDTWTLANVEEIARSGDVLTICASRELRGTAQSFRARVVRIIQVAREANPSIKVELGLIAPRAKEQRAPMLNLAAGSIDLADRLALYCDQDAESLESLKALLAGLRPSEA
jgi:hypothetical protein